MWCRQRNSPLRGKQATSRQAARSSWRTQAASYGAQRERRRGGKGGNGKLGACAGCTATDPEQSWECDDMSRQVSNVARSHFSEKFLARGAYASPQKGGSHSHCRGGHNCAGRSPGAFGRGGSEAQLLSGCARQPASEAMQSRGPCHVTGKISPTQPYACGTVRAAAVAVAMMSKTRERCAFFASMPPLSGSASGSAHRDEAPLAQGAVAAQAGSLATSLPLLVTPCEPRHADGSTKQDKPKL